MITKSHPELVAGDAQLRQLVTSAPAKRAVKTRLGTDYTDRPQDLLKDLQGVLE